MDKKTEKYYNENADEIPLDDFHIVDREYIARLKSEK